jgi:hypothetical protein
VRNGFDLQQNEVKIHSQPLTQHCIFLRYPIYSIASGVEPRRQSANWNVAIAVSAVNDAPTLYLAPGTWSCRSWEALYLGQVHINTHVSLNIYAVSHTVSRMSSHMSRVKSVNNSIQPIATHWSQSFVSA